MKSSWASQARKKLPQISFNPKLGFKPLLYLYFMKIRPKAP